MNGDSLGMVVGTTGGFQLQGNGMCNPLMLYDLGL